MPSPPPLQRRFPLLLLLLLLLMLTAAAAPIRLPDFSTCSLISDRSPVPVDPPLVLTYNCCLAAPPLSPAAVIDLSPIPPPHRSRRRIRRPAHKLSEAYKRKYETAYALMRALPEDDPRSFVAQARLHCAFCGGAYEQFLDGPPIEIHYSWLFLPWHRLFLYFHERILSSLLQDPTFALPFWNWDDQGYGGNRVPDVFLRHTHNSSLYDAARRNSPAEVVKLDALSPTTGDEAIALENLAVMSRAMLLSGRNALSNSSTSSAELFEGGAARLGTDLSNSTVLNAPLGGSLENGPHNSVHFWSGSPSLPLAQDMGSFPTGARDPIFYAHHANVDRLWELWRRHYGRDHSDPDFLDAEFLFYDEDARAVKVRASDALDLRRLGICYESVEQADRLWQEYAAPPLAGAKKQQQNEDSKGVGNYTDLTNLSSNGSATELVLRDKLRLKLRLPAEEAAADGMLLVLEGVRLPRNRFMQIVAFVNAEEADETTSTAVAECVGTYSAMPAGERRRSRAAPPQTAALVTTVKFRVPDSLRPPHSDAMFVTLVLRQSAVEDRHENVTFHAAKLVPFVGR